MIKKLTAHGNSSALVIDKPILDLLHITADTALEISTDGRNLIISPVASEAHERKFKRAMAKIHERHAATFRELAK
jgi:antitoxin component of MazEF toxin-antitoxin module